MISVILWKNRIWGIQTSFSMSTETDLNQAQSRSSLSYGLNFYFLYKMATKLFVGNLPFSLTEEQLKELFAPYSPDSVVIIMDKFSGRPKGFGFVEIADDEMAQKAIAELNEKDVDGRNIVVNVARPREDRPRRDFGGDRGGKRDFGSRDRY